MATKRFSIYDHDFYKKLMNKIPVGSGSAIDDLLKKDKFTIRSHEYRFLEDDPEAMARIIKALGL